MYLNPYYRHIQDLKRSFARGITISDMDAIRSMLVRKALRGNIKAAEMILKVDQWQYSLDKDSDTKHEMQSIMGSPTDGLMKQIRPGSIGISKETTIENKKQA
jgi:NADH dehydrogenase/NADH:ubiquinone oxidoreductase subunit G